jgi:hypothetical protein
MTFCMGGLMKGWKIQQSLLVKGAVQFLLHILLT